MTQPTPLDLDPIQARLDATGPAARLDMGDAINDIDHLITEVRRLRELVRVVQNELSSETRAHNQTINDRDALRAELEQYTVLDLGAPNGRVSASCDEPSHPTWLRKPNDTRSCPWCELEETRMESGRAANLITAGDPSEARTLLQQSAFRANQRRRATT